MQKTSRRQLLKGAGATASLIICEAVSPAAAAVLVPLQACGCPRVHEISYGHTCTVHDKDGKRWDAYTFEEIVALSRAEISVQTETTEWSCYCGRHDENFDPIVPVGTRGVWENTSYEYDEWEFTCADEYLASWIRGTAIDWIAEAKKDGFA
jgi:hypothetical protein